MKILKYKFIEFIPEETENGILYISVEYRTAVHNCICGCGNKVVTPLSPTDWRMTFDGRSVSLYPSVGNWNFDCKSHYWITNNIVKLAEQWSNKKIEEVRKDDKKRKKKYFWKRRRKKE